VSKIEQRASPNVIDGQLNVAVRRLTATFPKDGLGALLTHDGAVSLVLGGGLGHERAVQALLANPLAQMGDRRREGEHEGTGETRHQHARSY
jgi:hypothetical protein